MDFGDPFLIYYSVIEVCRSKSTSANFYTIQLLRRANTRPAPAMIINPPADRKTD